MPRSTASRRRPTRSERSSMTFWPGQNTTGCRANRAIVRRAWAEAAAADVRAAAADKDATSDAAAADDDDKPERKETEETEDEKGCARRVGIQRKRKQQTAAKEK